MADTPKPHLELDPLHLEGFRILAFQEGLGDSDEAAATLIVETLGLVLELAATRRLTVPGEEPREEYVEWWAAHAVDVLLITSPLGDDTPTFFSDLFPDVDDEAGT